MLCSFLDMCLLKPYVNPFEDWKDRFVRERGLGDASPVTTWVKSAPYFLYRGHHISDLSKVWIQYFFPNYPGDDSDFEMLPDPKLLYYNLPEP